MARRVKAKQIQEIAETAVVQTAGTALPESSAPAIDPEKQAIKRVSFPVDNNGNIAWDSMRSSSSTELRELLRRVYNDAALLGDLGVEPKPIVNVFDEDWTGSIFDGLGAIESLIAQKVYGIPPEIARECFTYNDAEKKKLAGPCAKVINKYATRYDWLVNFKEEIALGILLFAITSVKFRMASMRTEMLVASNKTRANGQEKPPATVILEPEAAPIQ